MSYARIINAVDAHAAGAHGRVVLGGVGALAVPGDTLFDKMLYMERHQDWFRRLMIKEPRGYPGACVNLVVPPTRPEAQAAYIIMEQPNYYPSMSGSNTMCVVTVLLQTGVLPMVEPVTELVLETPAGLINVRAECSGGKVRQVTLRNVPAFATAIDTPLDVPGLGTLSVDVGYGGMFYVQADAEKLGLVLEPSNGEQIVRVALQILVAAREQIPTAHPENPAINLLESALLYGPPKSPQNSARNAVVLSHGAIDRCPCGTGTSARMATLRRKGLLEIGEPFRHEGVMDTVFVGRVVADTQAGDLPAVVPEVSGRAWISGFHQFVLEDDDPFPEGFTIGDIWPASFSLPLSGVER